jgi:hypothetical protein
MIVRTERVLTMGGKRRRKTTDALAVPMGIAGSDAKTEAAAIEGEIADLSLS